MAKENSRVGSTGENRNLERVGDVAGTFSNTGGYMGVDGINNLIQEKNYPSFIDNITRMVQQQNQLGPDEFGSYVIPPSDPTYSTGQQYARSIAGGIPMSQVIGPGVSYSPGMPQGFTQADINSGAVPDPFAPPPPPPPVYKEPDDPSFFGTGIGGVTIPGGRRDKIPPLRDIFGANISSLIDLGKINKNLQYMSQKAKEAGITGTGGVDLTGESLRRGNIFDNLGGGKSGPGYDSIGMPTVGNGPGFFDPNYSLDKLNIDKYRTKVPAEQEVQVPPQEFNIEQIRQDIADSGIDFTNLFGLPQAPDLSQFVTKDDLPTGRDFSIENLDLPDFGEFALRKDLPVYQEPDLSGFARIEDLPTFNPDELRKDILMSLPEQQMQDLSGFTTQDDINKAIAGINMPTYEQPIGGRFSINQPQVRGLF